MTAVTEYNDILGKVRELAENVGKRVQDEFEDKSEQWQEGEKGQAVTSWQGEWEELSTLDDLDVTFSDFEIDDPEHLAMIEGVSEEAES